MAKYNGNNGVIKAIAAVIGEVKSFSLDATAEIIEVSALGDTSKGAMAGMLSWEVSITANYDPASAAQADLVEGASIYLELYPAVASRESGTTTGLQKLSGEAVISSVSVSVAENEVVSFEITATGNGPLSRGTA